MVLALQDHFVWDSWYVHDGDVWHGYYLKAPRSIGDPELRHFNVSYGHAISTDLTNWTDLGTTFKPSAGPAWDDYTTWTGSTVRGDDGLWHLYYTGSCKAEQGMKQRIGHATSTDMHNWTRVGEDGLILDLEGPNAHHYEADHTGQWHDRAMRDPWVMKDPEGEGWLMFFTARSSGIAEPNAGGNIGFATSPDGYDWTLEPPVFTGGFGQLEVPQVFAAGGQWYCLFCTAAEHFSKEQAEKTKPVTGNHYLIGDSPRGPWRIAPGFLDGDLPCRRYAARIVDTGDGLVILGFADRPDGSDFVGHVMDPQPVEITSDRLLKITPYLKAAE
ncbi:glycoside hydrolase family 68 protein [Poseidonocella sedimentorum]|uniref:Beta-fructofuranosidase n=1 Tax=Poseidonocella sedimentorum TaxID=871652 RepID=A0A1I6EQB6_9RHOB|nr:glycoside hydrolase family 68 protein [Poseidonocella sedimentorum]SFR19976.1 beta-fructofuranosidase [Poseidonocella sedimentorum]